MALQMFIKGLPQYLSRPLPPHMRKLLRTPVEQLQTAIGWCHQRQLFVQLEDGSYKTVLVPCDLCEVLRAAIGSDGNVSVPWRNKRVDRRRGPSGVVAVGMRGRCLRSLGGAPLAQADDLCVFDLPPVLRQTLLPSTPQPLEPHIAGRRLVVYVDASALTIAIEEALSNARKYRRPRSARTLAARWPPPAASAVPTLVGKLALRLSPLGSALPRLASSSPLAIPRTRFCALPQCTNRDQRRTQRGP